MEYILLILGFILLIKGADFAVSGGTGIAEHFRISPVIIGLTVIAFGTSLPETAVSVAGSISGQSGIAVGNVLGSNIFNLLMVGGLSALVYPMVIDRALLKRDLPVSLLAALIIVVFAGRAVIIGESVFTINRVGGLLLLLFFALFMVMLLWDAKKNRLDADEVSVEPKHGLFVNILITIGGLSAIVWGSDLVVDSATTIAYSFGLSETLVGLTIVSIGTSLPELVTSVVAAKKGSNEIAMGNIIGSNIFNLLLVLGLAAAIAPVTIPTYLFFDALLLVVVTVLTMFFCRKDAILSRKEGAVFLGIYILYFAYIFIRG
ncbi:MAG: calcium/sodium antiporter [Firmicutes bacterium]|nr:calcium/sodium antiporter [Bacillota bacterium]